MVGVKTGDHGSYTAAAVPFLFSSVHSAVVRTQAAVGQDIISFLDPLI